MTDGPRIRLFVAADIPSGRLEELATSVAKLRGELPEARWTDVANQHVTLKFLGPTPEERVDEVAAVVARAVGRAAPTLLSLGGLGAFPNERKARVLWASVQDERGATTGLARALDRAFEPMGVAPEKRPYTPHLTLARLKVPRRLPDLPVISEAARAPFALEEIVLYRSHLSPRGARYEALERWPLKGRP